METNYKKFITAALYVLLAAISCWATTESLHLLLPSWPKFFCWAVTIAFFFIASVGTKLIVDAFNPDIYQEHRGWKLIGGILIIILFWIIFSFPTNTHTFFYRNVINKEVRNDISTTRGYLSQIKNNVKQQNQIQEQLTNLDNNVETKLVELEAEIKNGVNPGFGPEAKRILSEFAAMLHVAKIDPLSLGGTTNPSKSKREQLCKDYRSKIYTLKESRKNAIIASMLRPEQAIKDADLSYKNLGLVEASIDNGKLNVFKATHINDIRNKINDGYSTIGRHKLFVSFNTPQDEERYTKPNVVTNIDHLLSVFDVWKDYINGKYKGYGFGFWIFLSLLVDIGAFIFFDISFRKTE